MEPDLRHEAGTLNPQRHGHGVDLLRGGAQVSNQELLDDFGLEPWRRKGAFGPQRCQEIRRKRRPVMGTQQFHHAVGSRHRDGCRDRGLPQGGMQVFRLAIGVS